MCAVIPLAVISAVIAVASTAVATGMQVDAESKRGAEASRVAKENQRLAMAQRADELQMGAWEASRVEREGRLMRGTALANAARSGLDPGSGSLANLIDASALNAQADIDRIKASAARRAWGYEREADATYRQGQNARQASYMGQVAAGLEGGTRILQTGTQLATTIARG